MLRTTDRTRRWQRLDRPRAVAVAAVVTAGALTLSACGGSGSGSGGKNTEGLGQVAAFAAKDRKPFPMLKAATLDGSTLDMASLQGKVIVVNVWGAWCPPCREETPYLERVYEQYKAKNVAFVGIDTRDDLSQAKAFVAEKQVTYPSLVDDGNEALLSKLVGIVPLQGVPTTVIIDKDGKVAWRATTPVTSTSLMAGLDPIVAEK